MSIKKERLNAICRIIRSETISNQEELLARMNASGFFVTQATLSRDVKQLKIVKAPDGNGNYIYRLPGHPALMQPNPEAVPSPGIEFSGNLAVVKTRPGYAMGIASDIDAHTPQEILATIAGDDTILIVPREGISRQEIIKALEPMLTINE
jgi:transcriptional regulator of arginine metabolism